jgi:hypothetical protein
LNSTFGVVAMEESASVAYHRAAAARARRLLTEATTPWLKEQLAAAIALHDQIAEQIESASKASARTASTSVRESALKRTRWLA